MSNSNVSGQAYALTVMAPIVSEGVSELVNYLDNLGSGDDSPLSKVGRTHFARWVVIDALVFEGGRQRPDSWSGPRLLFTSNFDGSLDSYLERLHTGLGECADRVWGYCKDYPQGQGLQAFGDWIKRYQIDTSLFYAAYGETTVEDVLDSLDVRSRLATFAGRHQGATAAELKAAFLKEFQP
ncbi:MAG: hypothetical protein ACTHK3_06785 [Solirubrobacterales bacterium]